SNRSVGDRPPVKRPRSGVPNEAAGGPGANKRSIPMRAICFLVLTLSFAAPLAAHDMWIEPSSFLPQAGQVISVRLRVGQDFLGDRIPRDPELIAQFVSLDSTGRKPVYGHDGGDPAGLVRVAEPGLMILGYQSHPKPILLGAATFNQYLKEEGLDSIADM